MKNTEIPKNQSLFLSLLDINTIQNIFIKLVADQNYIEDITILQNSSQWWSNEKAEGINIIESSFKLVFEDSSSFSLTCKIFYEISKNTKFEVNIFESQKIQNISYLIYIKLKYIEHIIIRIRRFEPPHKLKEIILNDMLMFSSKNGFYDIIKPLILNGADINSSFRQKCLNHCCQYGYLKTSKKLIKHGCSINYQGATGLTPLHFACETKNLNLIQYLVENGANLYNEDIYNKSPLFNACLNGNIDIVKYLINQGSNINHQNKYQQTILFEACKSKNEELIQYLINLGLNINHLDHIQRTCIYKTCLGQDLETTKYLISRGADLTIKYQNKFYNQNETLLQIVKNNRYPKFELIEELQKYF